MKLSASASSLDKKNAKLHLHDFKMNIAKTLNSDYLKKFHQKSCNPECSSPKRDLITFNLNSPQLSSNHNNSKYCKNRRRQSSTPCMPVKVSNNNYVNYKAANANTTPAATTTSSSINSDQSDCSGYGTCSTDEFYYNNATAGSSSGVNTNPSNSYFTYANVIKSSNNLKQQLQPPNASTTSNETDSTFIKSKCDSPFLLRKNLNLAYVHPFQTNDDKISNFSSSLSISDSNHNNNNDDNRFNAHQQVIRIKSRRSSSSSGSSGRSDHDSRPSSRGFGGGGRSSSRKSECSSQVTSNQLSTSRVDSGLSSLNSAQLFVAELREFIANSHKTKQKAITSTPVASTTFEPNKNACKALNQSHANVCGVGSSFLNLTNKIELVK